MTIGEPDMRVYSALMGLRVWYYRAMGDKAFAEDSASVFVWRLHNLIPNCKSKVWQQPKQHGQRGSLSQNRYGPYHLGPPDNNM